MSTISVDRLTKTFGDFVAVNKLSFEVNENEIFGLLGPNGAGKSTTINMLCGILRPTSGKAYVGKYDLLTEAEKIKKIIGVVPQEISVYSDLTVYENLDFFSGIFLKNRTDRDQKIEETVKLLKLEKKLNTLCENLSGGTKRRLSIAMALLNDPKILFLDEPTAGIDAPTINIVENLMREKRKESSILVTTHSLSEAEAMCDRVLIMSEGRKVAEGTPEHLREDFARRVGETIMIKFSSRMRNSEVIKITNMIRKLDFVTDVSVFNNELTLRTKRIGKDVFKIFKKLELDEEYIVGISIKKPSLVEAFVHLVDEK